MADKEALHRLIVEKESVINALRLDTLSLRKTVGAEKDLMEEKSIHLKMLTNLEAALK